MVVTFKPPADDGKRAPHAKSMPASGIAPVTYLPGAQPTGEAVEALRRVNEAADSSPSPFEERRSRAETRAGNVSIHQLARRGMSRWELEQVLAKREIEADTAAAELDRLESVGLLDDAALAVSVVYTQHTRKGLGRTAIAAELRRRHIDQGLIDDALSEIEDDDEEERALELVVSRIRQLSSYDDVTVRRRLSAYLARKGYSSEVVRHAVDRAMESRGGRAGTVRFR